MLEWYILAVIGFALGFDQHRTILNSDVPYPTFGLTPVLFDASAWVGGIATLAMLVAGAVFGSWWWPFLAMLIGTGTNYCGRIVIPMELRWAVSMAGTLLGIGATIIFFK
ncbi:MAG: hypothetical protein ACKVIK_03985 [Rhodospirillales bacterium]|jgi:hypothetical protein